ncbi:MAG: hypothetical protein KDD47_18000, partial [Acidobacteria bacterium]|nr:hypothetical protein [Acidobacteriota bacterium]
MNRAQKRRLLVVVGAIFGLLVAARHIALRSQGPRFPGTSKSLAGSVSSAAPGPGELRPELTRERQTALLAAARAMLQGGPAPGPPSEESRDKELVFVSLSRLESTALVSRGEGKSLEGAIAAAVGELARRASPEEINRGLLKIDVLAWRGPMERFDAHGKSTIDRSLDGVELPDANLELLPEEILSRRLVDETGDLQSGRLRRYLEEGGRPVRQLRGNPSRSGSPFRRLRFVSFAEGLGGQAVRLYRGNPLEPEISTEALLAASQAGGDYLVRHQRSD